MKKLLMTVVCHASESKAWAQDFASGRQARSWLDFNAVSGDHAAGLLHCKITTCDGNGMRPKGDVFDFNSL